MNRLILKNTIRLLNPSLNGKLVRVSSIRTYADGFSYLFPDTPSDEPSTNYMLNVPKQGEIINFNKINPHQSFRAVLKTLFELEGCFEELNSFEIEDANELTFDKIYNEIDEKLVHLNYAFSTFQLMGLFDPKKFTLRKNGSTKLVKAYNDVRNSVFKSRKIFNLMLKLDDQRDKLTEQQRRIVKKYITEGKLNGLHMDKELAIDQIKKGIKHYEQIFIKNVNTHSANFIQKVINADYVKTLPHYLKSIVEGKSKVNLYFSPVIYEHFLANCNDQHERYTYWYEYNNRASLHNCDRNIANNVLVDEIVHERRKLAEHLGFVNYIEYSLQTRTLDSILAIKELIEKLFEQTREAYNQDFTKILNFASLQKPIRKRI